MPADSGSGKDGFLASPEEISRLLARVWTALPPASAARHPKPAGAAARRPDNADPRKIKRSSAPRVRQRCRCGRCPICLDNARWERIFNEKFADPGYYRRLALRYNSTLAEPR
jgi:hypothetical protein